MILDAGESPEWGATEGCQGDALDRDKMRTKGPTNRFDDACRYLLRWQLLESRTNISGT
jgi:hypothetical protein